MQKLAAQASELLVETGMLMSLVNVGFCHRYCIRPKSTEACPQMSFRQSSSCQETLGNRDAPRESVYIHSLLVAAQGDDAYTALLAKVTGILDKRQHVYRQSDLHIPLERSPGDPSDCGATPAAVAYRRARLLCMLCRACCAELSCPHSAKLGCGVLP